VTILDSNSDPSVVTPVAIRYTDYARIIHLSGLRKCRTREKKLRHPRNKDYENIFEFSTVTIEVLVTYRAISGTEELGDDASRFP
jgi:hypothetical protein